MPLKNVRDYFRKLLAIVLVVLCAALATSAGYWLHWCVHEGYCR